jgi:hypothetical protein
MALRAQAALFRFNPLRGFVAARPQAAPLFLLKPALSPPSRIAVNSVYFGIKSIHGLYGIYGKT